MVNGLLNCEIDFMLNYSQQLRLTDDYLDLWKTQVTNFIYTYIYFFLPPFFFLVGLSIRLPSSNPIYDTIRYIPIRNVSTMRKSIWYLVEFEWKSRFHHKVTFYFLLPPQKKSFYWLSAYVREEYGGLSSPSPWTLPSASFPMWKAGKRENYHLFLVYAKYALSTVTSMYVCEKPFSLFSNKL